MVVGKSTERATLRDGCFVGDRVWASDLYDFSENARMHPGTVVARDAARGLITIRWDGDGLAQQVPDDAGHVSRLPEVGESVHATDFSYWGRDAETRQWPCVVLRASHDDAPDAARRGSPPPVSVIFEDGCRATVPLEHVTLGLRAEDSLPRRPSGGQLSDACLCDGAEPRERAASSGSLSGLARAQSSEALLRLEAMTSLAQV